MRTHLPLFFILVPFPFPCYFPNFPVMVSFLLILPPSFLFFFSLFVPQQEDGPSGKPASMVPLVIPVSVPVHRSQVDPQGGWAQGRLGQGERPAGPQSDRKPSVIVARRRSLRNSMTESFGQVSAMKPSQSG